MNKNIILIALLCLLSIDRVGAQSVTVEAMIDSLQMPSNGLFFPLIPIHWYEG